MSTTRVHRTKPVVLEAGGRNPMPEPTFLQIQGGGDSTMRMIELPLGPVRIGRGAHCEVRLGGPGLGDVQCMLRRRGDTWHYQPVGPSGQVWIDGRGADQQRPIPLGVPFRVGEHWLVLRPADSATNDWGSFDEPITIEPTAEPEPDPEPEPNPEPQPTTLATRDVAIPEPDRPRASPATEEGAERLRRWEARLEQRERWLKDRQEERRWEARWKSAGESIRARAASPAPRPVPPTRSPSTTPTSPTAADPRRPQRPTQTPRSPGSSSPAVPSRSGGSPSRPPEPPRRGSSSAPWPILPP